MSDYRSGLDCLLHGEQFDLIKGKRVGLVTNHTGLSLQMQSTVDLMYEHESIDLIAVFAPEHGVRGSVQAGGVVETTVDPYTGLSVYSLYGETEKPTKEMLEKIEVLIYDIQDVGVRYYTYISTLFYCLESCAENGVSFVVLDRLNPIGRRIEGNIVQPGFGSFVGAYPLPQRHGMTVGELARWANGEFQLGADLHIVELRDWQGQYADELNLQWIPPSPNIPSFATAIVYPVTCMFEGTNISEGRGTANPFEYVGAPWIDPHKLANVLIAEKLPGVTFRPIHFMPTFSKHQGEECGGVHVIVTDREKVNSCLSGLTLLQTVRSMYPNATEWRRKPEEGTALLPFDLLMGTDSVRKSLEKDYDPRDIVDGWIEEQADFAEVRKRYLLYGDMG